MSPIKVSHPAYLSFLRISDNYIEEKAETRYKHNECKAIVVLSQIQRKEEEECHIQVDDDEMNNKWCPYCLLSVQVSTALAHYVEEGREF
ncbi:hypothetical protein KIN20_036813 [Parelaphostrongylus tenuis]|uniref:Uncharacterized protein n=1 Tax=Parelaphostrongylus tenuis TaxID=148309 RepID=A0AAD5RDJ6_PARTN|nr:hypothetical protein KIN20_036813 [Parelaphostrongylus tenuis]